MTWKDVATFSIAGIGAVLGVINLLHLLDRSRVKLRVVPKSGFKGPGRVYTHRDKWMPDSFPCIEVINLSDFAVTIEEVGFTLPHTADRRVASCSPLVLDNKPWPRRLEPRESVTAYLDPEGLHADIGKAYAETACGERRFGTSPAFKELRQLLKQRQ
jgi:hypothetical protein